MREFFEVINEYPKTSIGLGVYLFASLALILSVIEYVSKNKKR